VLKLDSSEQIRHAMAAVCAGDARSYQTTNQSASTFGERSSVCEPGLDVGIRLSAAA